MRLSSSLLISTLLSVGTSLLSAVQQSSQFRPIIAAIRAGTDSLDKVRTLYGNGAETTVQNIRSLCYYVEQDQAYLSVSSFEDETRIRSIALTTIANIAPGCQGARIVGKHLTALGGISLGDSPGKVMSMLGEPAGHGKVQMGNHELFYNDYSVAGAQLSCQYEHDKLVLIAVEAPPGQTPIASRRPLLRSLKLPPFAPSISIKVMPQALLRVAGISPMMHGRTS